MKKHMRQRAPLLYFIVFVLVGLNIYVYSELATPNPHVLTVTFLDVGQGDAILIEGPTGIDMLIDAGPDRSVLRTLPRAIGLFDRSIDMIVESHPDKDHIAGLPGVLGRYEVRYFLTPAIESDSPYVSELQSAIREEEGITTFTATRGMRIHLGAGAYADVLYPDRPVPTIETNTGSIIMRVVYGDTEVMLSGDAPSSVEEYVVSLQATPGALQSEVLKAGHHGSKTSTSDVWLKAVHPQTVVVSAGKNNSYGHPAGEVVARIREFGADLISTQEQGSITFVLDGSSIMQK